MTRIAVKRPVTTFMVILIFLAFGLMSLNNLSMDLLPNMNIPIAAVVTSYNGASPDQMQKLVTEPIEGQLASLSGLDTMMSQSMENLSYVIMQFDQDVDIDMVSLDIREAVDLVKYSLPDDANDPMVFKMDVNAMSAIYISVSSDTDDLVALKNKVDDQLSDRLVRQNGVAQVEVYGGREKEIRVDLIEQRIRGLGISESAVAQLIAAENASLPVGTIEESARDMQIKIDGQFVDVEDIKNIPVTTAGGAVVYVRDIAQVYETFKEVESYSYLNGQPAVTMSISKQSTANTVNVSDAVMKELDRIIAEYPELEIKVILDPADYINESLSSVANSAVTGVILAIIVLFVFLRNVRSTLVVGAAIPMSILVTFAFMYFADMTLNLMSLGGLTLGVGMLVDNSIVVLESIFRRMEEGESKTRAAINGAREVSMSIVASTLTTVAVFVPVAWMGGMIAQIFNDLALSIGFALGASLLVALTFVPLLCALFLSPAMKIEGKLFENRGPVLRALGALLTPIGRVIGKVLDILGKGIDGLEKGYRKALFWSTNHRKSTMGLAFLLFAVGMVTATQVGLELLPSADQSQIDISVSLPTGAVLERSKTITDEVLSRIEGMPEIQDVSTSISGDYGSITVALVSMKDRDRTSVEIASDIRSRVSDIAGANIYVEAVTSLMGGGMSMGGGSGGTTIQYTIKGDDVDELSQVADDLADLLNTINGVRDSSSSVSSTTPQATIKINRDKASTYGLTASTVMQLVRANVTGSTPTTLKVGGDEIDIRIGQEDSKFQTLQDVETLLIPTPLGPSVPLREIADIQIVESPMYIYRENQQTMVSVYGYIDERDLGSVTREADALIASSFIFPQGISLETSGTASTMDEELQALVYAFLVAIFVVYAIMAAEFESLYYPIIIFLAVPIAISTSFLGLFVMGHTLGITAALGMIMLLGIVVNNGIVLIDYINLLRGRGMDLMEAVQKAGPVRLRAILMTTLTTALGLLPMMLGAQEGSEMMQPLATVVVWGLSFSTVITLFLVPCIYISFDRIRSRLLGHRTKFRKVEEL